VFRLWRRAGVGRGIGWWQAGSFVVAWLTLVIALTSPLDEWSEHLFAAHMLQHELLMVVAAPLIALSSPFAALASAFHHTYLPANAILRPIGRSTATLWAGLVCALHAVALWGWHIPALYDAALAHQSVHAVQHLSFFGTAVLFWWVLVHGRHGRAGYGAAVLFVFGTALHSGFLGALLALSPRIWYAPYATTSALWRLSPLEDQQLAGLIMWVPGSVVFAAAGLTFLLAWLRDSARRVDVIAGRWEPRQSRPDAAQNAAMLADR
jgi:cytochrome c oxidase assembly factor CtaG